MLLRGATHTLPNAISLIRKRGLKHRIQNILEQLPQAVFQAHERLIGERRVARGDKILSLYDPAIHVLVRGKAGAEVEFGNGLYLAEQTDGLIVDWDFMEKQPPADSQLVEPALNASAENTVHPKAAPPTTASTVRPTQLNLKNPGSRMPCRRGKPAFLGEALNKPELRKVFRDRRRYFSWEGISRSLPSGICSGPRADFFCTAASCSTGAWSALKNFLSLADAARAFSLSPFIRYA